MSPWKWKGFSFKSYFFLNTSSYTYLNNVLTIIDELGEEMIFPCSFTSTDPSVTISESIDTAWVEPLIWDITLSVYYGQTTHFSRNSVVNTNVNQRLEKLIIAGL